jgi:hypothetical protein
MIRMRKNEIDEDIQYLSMKKRDREKKWPTLQCEYDVVHFRQKRNR